MTSRKSNGTGSLRERPKGSGNWQWQIRSGKDPVTGDERRISKTFKAKTRSAADKQLRAFLAEMEENPVEGSSATMGLLFDEWLVQMHSLGRSPHTIYTSKRIIENVLKPVFGDVRLHDLSARSLDKWYASLRTQSKPLSAASVRRYHAIISSALSQAVKWEWIPENVAAKASPPVVKQSTLIIPTMAEIGQLAEKMSDYHPAYGIAVILATATGMRRGELCGLRWSDIEGDGIVVRSSVVRLEKETVVKSTKTGRERWVSPAPQVFELLNWWHEDRMEQAALLNTKINPEGFVLSHFPDQSVPQNPDSLTATFSRAAKELDLTHVHLHSLRHYAATELLAGGVDVKNTASMLGHANPRMTLETYAHSTNDRQRHAGSVLGMAVPTLSGRERKRTSNVSKK